eukprot:GHVP01009713.1.p1 GENE.GHVP01009713.1~~GHVP01009713.1.p1  ORF type:complete len:461 (+),score=70.71 GHVP01009713.1:26-1384(+)
MPVEANLLRTDKGGDPELVRKSELKRGRDGKCIDEWIELDELWRKNQFETEQLRKQLNEFSKKIGSLKKEGKHEEFEETKKQSTILKEEMLKKESQADELNNKRNAILHGIGNIVDASVVHSSDEDRNDVIRIWGTPSDMEVDGTPGKLHHHEVLSLLEGYDPKAGAEVAGHRGFFLKGDAVLLNMALQNYGMRFLYGQGYTPIIPPYFMKKDIMAATAELKDFEETLYRIPMGGDEINPDRDDVFLIATSEQPISALHKGQNIEAHNLPFRYSGNSPCFRKEAGSSGKDMWGIFRTHQFDKVEQFVITSPEESIKEHEKMIATAESFYQSLGLPYRIVSIVAGALNDAAAKKYDLEAWFPGYKAYRELVSCSNCTDYQSRALGIRLGHPKMGDREKKFVHMLNGTLCATQRTLCCILENYQTPEGVIVPDVLRPYMGGVEFLKFPTPSASA